MDQSISLSNCWHKLCPNLSRLAMAGVVLLSLSGCVLPETDPTYLGYRANIDHNPQPDAIVGMWSKRGGRNAPESSMSLLFRRDGNGMQKELRSINLEAALSSVGPPKLVDIEPIRFTYHYNGDGSWTDSLGGKIWLSNGSLLREATTYVTGDRLSGVSGDFVPTKHVFTRVE